MRSSSLKQLCTGIGLITLLSLPQPSVAKKVKDPLNVHVHTLSNGLTVYLSKNDQSPRFYSEIAVRAGSKHDPANATGLAHYLEHLLFKGTDQYGTQNYQAEQKLLSEIRALYQQRFKEADSQKRAQLYQKITGLSNQAAKLAIPNEFDRMYKEMGSKYLNAHTWHEETVYKVGLPSNRLEQWAQVEKDRFQSPVFRLFQPELEIVYEEKNRSMDNKMQALRTAVNKMLYKSHPYGQQTTIGTVEHLKNPSIVEIEKYYQKHYVPRNMGIFIAGDIDIEKTIDLLERTVGTWPDKPLPEEPTWKDTPINGIERVTVPFKAEPMVLLAFQTAANNHKDADALKLIDMILDNRTAGLINLSLNQQQKVRYAGAYPQLHNDAGAQILYGIPKSSQSHEEVEKLLLAQLEKIKNGQFDDWLLDAIVTDYKKSYKQQMESNRSRVSMMSNSFLRKQSWKHTISEIARMDKLKKKDIMRVANKYFTNKYIAGYRVNKQPKLPKIEKPKLDPVPINPALRSPYAKKLLDQKINPIKPYFLQSKRDYMHGESIPGVMLYTTLNPINDLFSLTINIDVGKRQNSSLQIAAELLSKAGAKDFTAPQLQQEWYKLGTTFSTSVSTNQTQITIAGLEENFDASLVLLAKAIKEAKVSDAEVGKMLKIWIGSRKDQRNDQRVILGAMSELSLFGDKSMYKNLKTDAQIQQLKGKELLQEFADLLNNECQVKYTGTLPRSTVTEKLRSNIFTRTDFKKSTAKQNPTIQAIESTQIRIFDKKMAQANVRIQFPSLKRNEADAALMELYNNYFGVGMDAIVFQELREARALAYSAYARYQDGFYKNDPNMMSGFIGTQTDKTSQAIEMFIQLMDNLPASPNRFQSAKGAILNRYQTDRIPFRSILDYFSSWKRKGLNGDPRESRYQSMQSVTLEQLLAFHKTHIKDRAKMISIVGDKSKIDIPALEKLGTVTIVSEKDIFTY